MPTRTAKLVLMLAVFAAVGVILLGPVSGAVAQNTGVQSVTNETVYADFSERTDLTGYDVEPGSETVWVYNDTAGAYEQGTAGTDYKLYEEPGEVQLLNSSLVEANEKVLVSYDYQAAGQLASLVIGFIPLAVGLLIFLGIARPVTEML